MSRNVKEIADALRAATNLKDVRKLADELSPLVPVKDKARMEDKQDRPKLRLIECVVPGILLGIAVLCVTSSIMVLMGSAIGFLYCAWEMDGTGLVRSIIWFAGASVAYRGGAWAFERLTAWFNQFQLPFFST